MIQKLKDFLENVKIEFRKVTWPEHEQLMNSSWVVCVISALFTLFIFAADYVLRLAVDLLYK